MRLRQAARRDDLGSLRVGGAQRFQGTLDPTVHPLGLLPSEAARHLFGEAEGASLGLRQAKQGSGARGIHADRASLLLYEPGEFLEHLDIVQEPDRDTGRFDTVLPIRWDDHNSPSSTAAVARSNLDISLESDTELDSVRRVQARTHAARRTNPKILSNCREHPRFVQARLLRLVDTRTMPLFTDDTAWNDELAEAVLPEFARTTQEMRQYLAELRASATLQARNQL